MTIRTWALFAATDLVACFVPGPAVLFVVGSALRHGARAALRANLGILSANAFYFALSATGLGALLLASHALFTGLRWMGAAYLVWLGVRLWLTNAAPRAVPATARELPSGSLYARAVLLQLSNPKALVFFAALLPQFIDSTRPIATQFAILGVTSTLFELCVLAFYGSAAGAAAERLHTPRWQRRLDRASGSCLLAAGLKLAVD